MKKAIIGTLSILATLATAVTAQAQVAYMSGLFGVTPDYASIIAPTGQGCNPRAGCTQIKYNNLSVASGTAALTNWIAAHPGPNTIWTYSATTDSVIQYLNAHPEDTTTQFYLLGSPSTPGDATLNPKTLPTGVHNNVTFVVRQYDIAADKPAGTANNARGNLSQSIHLNGYNNLNLTTSAITWTDPRTGSTTEYFLTYPLPEISTAFKTAAQIAAEDQAKRPGVESQYYLPGQIQRPVVLPPPVYPAATVATEAEVTKASASTTASTPATVTADAVAAPATDSSATNEAAVAERNSRHPDKVARNRPDRRHAVSPRHARGARIN